MAQAMLHPSDKDPSPGTPVRGTQKLVDQMGWVFHRPSLIAIEIGWRWIFGAPLLFVCWQQAQHILAALSPESTGLANLDSRNPWVAAVQLASAWDQYEHYLVAVVRWLAPAAAFAWVVISGLGRGVVLRTIEPKVRFRPAAMIVLQACWLVLFALIFRGWFGSIQWIAATHITAGGEPDLVGYSIWVIFLSLGFFTVWALVSWPLSIAPMLMLLENRSPLSTLRESLLLGRTFNGKLMEINLVMGIVKLALIVLAMVFSAAPLPFSDQLGPGAMRLVCIGATLFYLVASDYFHVVRLKSFVELWRTFRGDTSVAR